MNHRTRLHFSRRGVSLLEILAVVTLVGIIAIIAVPRIAHTGDAAKANSCFATKGMVEVQAELWFRNKGTAPQADLSDIMAVPAYFPDGTVTCPVDGTAYQFDSATMSVSGHTHADLLD